MCFKRKEKYQLTFDSMKRASYMMFFIFWAPYTEDVELTDQEKEVLDKLCDDMLKVKDPKLGWGVLDKKKMRKAYEKLWNFFTLHKETIEPFVERAMEWNEVTQNNNYVCAAVKDARAIGINYLAEEMNASLNK